MQDDGNQDDPVNKRPVSSLRDHFESISSETAHKISRAIPAKSIDSVQKTRNVLDVVAFTNKTSNQQKQHEDLVGAKLRPPIEDDIRHGKAEHTQEASKIKPTITGHLTILKDRASDYGVLRTAQPSHRNHSDYQAWNRNTHNNQSNPALLLSESSNDQGTRLSATGAMPVSRPYPQPPHINRAAKPITRSRSPKAQLDTPSLNSRISVAGPSPFSTPSGSDAEDETNGRAAAHSLAKQSSTKLKHVRPKSPSYSERAMSVDFTHGELSGGRPQTFTNSPTPIRQGQGDRYRGRVPPLPERRNTQQLHRMNQMAGLEGDVESPSITHATNPPYDNAGELDTGLPNIANFNRRPPILSSGVSYFLADHEFRHVCSWAHVFCTAGSCARVWDTTSGAMLLELTPADRDTKYTSMAFVHLSGQFEDVPALWLGTSGGFIEEIDIDQRIVRFVRKPGRSRAAITQILSPINSMWVLDERGNVRIWKSSDVGYLSLSDSPYQFDGFNASTLSLAMNDHLWSSQEKNVHIHRLESKSSHSLIKVGAHSQPHIGATTCVSASVSMCMIFFGHSDGKVSVYNTRTLELIGIVSLHVHKIYAIQAEKSFVWVGFGTGDVCIYDVSTRPWNLQKMWPAHGGDPILSLTTDRAVDANTTSTRIISSGVDGFVRIWDSTLARDERDNYLEEHDVEHATFSEISLRLMTWNAGAITPENINADRRENSFFPIFVETSDSPDILAFGFQELVDLEDKKQTAKSLFRGSMKKDSNLQDHMSHRYRAWRDYLTQCVKNNNSDYELLHVSNLVGLFSCVFVKQTLRSRVSNLAFGEVKRGMGGLHGNKGALAIRFCIDTTSICLINCHLAAGQIQTSSRNNDISAILCASLFPSEKNEDRRGRIYRGGGDGSMILDHEICILSGDLNYRIDTMGRVAILKALSTSNYDRVLERDQLRLSRRRNPLLLLRAFVEAPIQFDPTYKYDINSNEYDTSDKRRTPAWCDRILYRGLGRIKQINYERHEFMLSDHRPVTADFRVRIRNLPLSSWTAFKDHFSGT